MKKLRKAVDEEDSKQFINERNEALATALAEVMDVQVPDTIITTQAREKYATMMAEFRDQGMADEEIKKLITPENFLKYKDIYKDGIVKDFKVTIGVEELAKLENIQVPDYQIQEQMENLKMEAQKAGDEFDEGTVRQRVEATLQSRLVFDFLAENSNLEVEYVDESEENVDEELLAKLGEESLKREGFDGSFQDVKVEEEKGEDQSQVEAKAAAEAEAKAAEEAKAKTAAEAKAKAKAKATEEAKVKAASETDPDAVAAKYAEMPLEERAYNILLDLGMIELTPDPDSPDYDSTNEDEFVS